MCKKTSLGFSKFMRVECRAASENTSRWNRMMCSKTLTRITSVTGRFPKIDSRKLKLFSLQHISQPAFSLSHFSPYLTESSRSKIDVPNLRLKSRRTEQCLPLLPTFTLGTPLLQGSCTKAQDMSAWVGRVTGRVWWELHASGRLRTVLVSRWSPGCAARQ